MKSVGVIGGVGPETTAEFYIAVIFECQKRNTQQRPSIVVASVPLPFEIERDLIATNTGIERYKPFLIAEAQSLEKSGVDFLVMPCNSLHVFIEDIRAAVSVPVLSIVEVTRKHLQSKGYKRVGLISTSATVKNSIYERELTQHDIEFVVPNDLQKAQMDKIIQRLVDGQHLNNDRETILGVVEELSSQNVDCVALACTDLQLLLPASDRVEIFDTMKLLAIATADEILG